MQNLFIIYAFFTANGGCREYHIGAGKGDYEAARREIVKARPKPASNKVTTD